MSLLGEYSQQNIFTRQIMGLYLYASGAQRQVISVMSHLGISESYSSVTRKPRKATVEDVEDEGEEQPTVSQTPNFDLPVLNSEKAEKKKKKRPRKIQPWDAGTLRVLSNSMRQVSRSVAATGLFASVYDNINMVFRVSEQIMGRTGELKLILLQMNQC